MGRKVACETRRGLAILALNRKLCPHNDICVYVCVLFDKEEAKVIRWGEHTWRRWMVGWVLGGMMGVGWKRKGRRDVGAKEKTSIGTFRGLGPSVAHEFLAPVSGGARALNPKA